MTPTPKPQPDRASYGAGELEMFPRLTRAIYRETFSKEAPSFDASRPVQRFFDSTVANQPGEDTYVIEYYDVVGNTVIRRRKSITNAQVAQPNLPGTTSYAKYVIAPTGAHLLDAVSGGITPLNPEILSTREQANALQAEFAGSGLATGAVIENKFPSPFTTLMYPNGEQRRAWEVEVAVNGNAKHGVNVGRALAVRHKQGVDAPGVWLTKGDSVDWESRIPQDTGTLVPELPIPMRLKMDNEVLSVNPFSGVVVTRTDLQPPAPPHPGDSSELLAIARDILEGVREIQGKLA